MGVYGGLVIIMIYASIEQAYEQEYALMTQDNLYIYTQQSQYIWTQQR